MRSALITLLALASLTLSAPNRRSEQCENESVINNPGFESGKTPSTSGHPGDSWTINSVVGASVGILTSPGSPSNGGKYAFSAFLYPDPSSNGASSLTLSQTMDTCTGHNYSIEVDYTFYSIANNDCSLQINYPYKTIRGSVTVSSGVDGQIPGQWYVQGLVGFFQAVSNADLFNMVFSCSNGANDRISVDNVLIKPFAGNAY